jgi:hypothetical protein
MWFEFFLLTLYREGWLSYKDLGKYDTSLCEINSRTFFLDQIESSFVVRFKQNHFQNSLSFTNWRINRGIEMNQHLFNDKFDPSGNCHYPSVRFTWSNIGNVSLMRIEELKVFGSILLFPGLQFNSQLNTQMPTIVIIHSILTEHLSHIKSYKTIIEQFNKIFPKIQGIREIQTSDIYYIILGLLSLVKKTSKLYKSWKLLELSLKTRSQLCSEGVLAIVTLMVELFDKQRVYIGRTILGGHSMQGLFAKSYIQSGEEFAHGIYVTCNKNSTSCEQHPKQGLFGVPFCINSVTKATSQKLNINVVFRDNVIANILDARKNCTMKLYVNVTYVNAVEDIEKKNELYWKYTVHRKR